MTTRPFSLTRNRVSVTSSTYVISTQLCHKSETRANGGEGAAIVSARVRAVSAAPPRNHAIDDHQQIVLEAGKSRFVNRQFEAQLALGELKLKFGDNTDARAILQALEEDASAKGFQLIAAKAAQDLGTSQQARGH
jgi:hypothetical protein